MDAGGASGDARQAEPSLRDDEHTTMFPAPARCAGTAFISSEDG